MDFQTRPSTTSLVLVALVEVPKADCRYWWTVGEHRADCKPLVLSTAFHGLEEGTVSALTKLEAALTLRRNLPERHVYDHLLRHAAEHGKLRLVEKLSSRQKEQDQGCSFRRTGPQDMDVRSLPRQAKPFGAKMTRNDGKAGQVMTHVFHRARQEQRQV